MSSWTSWERCPPGDALRDVDPEIAGLVEEEIARQHNDSNVLVLPARFLSEEQGVEILKAWLETPFEGGRHARRVDKIEIPDSNPDANP